MKTALCIPTLNASGTAPALIASIAAQKLQPSHILVIDSTSTDTTRELFERTGAEIYVIAPHEFNHGATRQLGVRQLAAADVIVFMTQDAVLANEMALDRLVGCFQDEAVACAYGRQLPRPGAGAIETHARLFNYPPVTYTRKLEDREMLGIKTAFLSNSFAAYRRADLIAVGGFPSGLIMGEDTYVAAKMLLAGKNIGYCADAMVFHSHAYSWAEEFRRYFDTGVLHAREPWIRQRFGRPDGEGFKFLKSELRYLVGRNPLLLPSALIRTGLKLSGFQLGLWESKLPVGLKRQLSMLSSFWRQ